ncbi:glycosyltransferase family 61 protein [Acuticoccus yangtzensis]|uniref:glycosyltransferase family 61 protein n=1 Tax=Acuticoccus yangtzensis TaxID=1443441 RepID=UPI0009495C9C|nr:glycosyltransferase 61 family protein [Acuticoccus yangtzensis]
MTDSTAPDRAAAPPGNLAPANAAPGNLASGNHAPDDGAPDAAFTLEDRLLEHRRDAALAGATTVSAAERTHLAKVMRMAHEGRPVPLMMGMKAKSVFKAAFPLEEAFARYAAAMGLGAGTQLHTQEIVPFSAAAARHAETVHVLHEGGETVRLDPPRTIGEPAETAVLEGPSRRVELAAFRSASAFAHTSAIRLKNGTYVFDIQEGEAERLPVDRAFEPIVFHGEGGTLHIIDNRRRTDVLTLPEAITLMGASSMSFGHFMAEELIRLLSIRKTIDITGIPILIDAAMPHQHKEAVLAFTGARHPVIEVPRGLRVEAGRLWAMTNWGYSPKIVTTDVGVDTNAIVMPTKPLAALLTAAANELAIRLGLPDEDAPADGRLYLARDATRHRAIANHEAVSALLAGHGFAETRPETLSFIQQFALYRGASQIVVQSGSATLGLLLARPGTRVCLLTHGAIARQALLAQPMRDIGLDLVALVGGFTAADSTYQDRSSYRIDEDVLAALLQSELRVS